MRTHHLMRAALTALALLLVLSNPRGALAGGVSVTLDDVPSNLEAGVPFTVGFLIRSAHEDRTLIVDVTPLITAVNLDTKEEVVATSKAEGGPGHYVATITLPTAGTWSWRMQPYGKLIPDYEVTLQGPLKVSAEPVARDEGPRQVVGVKDTTYAPESITIEAGTTVTWVNNSKLPHTITADSGAFASGNLDPDKSFSFTFEEAGTFTYYCDYHGTPQTRSGNGVVLVGVQSGGGQNGLITVVAAKADAKQDEARSEPAPLAAAPAAQPAAQASVPTSSAPTGFLLAGGVALLALLGTGLVLVMKSRQRIRNG